MSGSADRHVGLQHSVHVARLTMPMRFETKCGHFKGDPASNQQPVKSTKQICGVLVTFADIANHTCQTVLHELQCADDFIAGPIQKTIAVVNAWPDDAASHCVATFCVRLRRMWRRARMWKLQVLTISVTCSSKVKVLSNLTPSVFGVSDIVTSHPATETVTGRLSWRNLSRVPKNAISDLSRFSSKSLRQN